MELTNEQAELAKFGKKLAQDARWDDIGLNVEWDEEPLYDGSTNHLKWFIYRYDVNEPIVEAFLGVIRMTSSKFKVYYRDYEMTYHFVDEYSNLPNAAIALLDHARERIEAIQ